MQGKEVYNFVYLLVALLPNRETMILYPQNNNISHIAQVCYLNYHYAAIWIHVIEAKSQNDVAVPT